MINLRFLNIYIIDNILNKQELIWLYTNGLKLLFNSNNSI